MKKLNILLTLILAFTFIVGGCACNNEKAISSEDALNVLKDSKIEENVIVTTTTETTVNETKTTSLQTDYYYNDKYYHTSDANNLSTKTWYGYVDNVLYAFYYTKNANNEEVKYSTRIDDSTLTAAKSQTSIIKNSLFSESGTLLENHEIAGSKKGDTYTIQVTQNSQDESNIYTFTIEDGKIHKLIKTNNIGNDTIKTTYEYNYIVNDINLPSISEYPLNANE